MKSVVIFSKTGCSFCAALAKEYALIQSDLAKLGIAFTVWDQGTNGEAVLKHAGGRRAGPSPAALGINGQFPMPSIFLISGKQWKASDPSTDHAFLKDALALFDGAITRGPSGEIRLSHYGRMARNRANILTWVKADHSLPPPAPYQAKPAPEVVPPTGARTTCSTRFVSAVSNSQRRR